MLEWGGRRARHKPKDWVSAILSLFMPLTDSAYLYSEVESTLQALWGEMDFLQMSEFMYAD